MLLTRGTEDFVLLGQKKPGFPIILNEDMTGCVVANSFLRHHLSRGRIGSRKSWEPIGQTIYDYFAFLEANQLVWDDVDRGEAKNVVAAYRDYCKDICKHKTSTVRLRVIYVCLLYEWAVGEGLVTTLPFDWENRRLMTRDQNPSDQAEKSEEKGDSRSVMPKKRHFLVEYLTFEESKALLLAPMNPHHRMIIRLALGSGLRREELATFPECYVFNPDLKPSKSRNVYIDLDPEDGNGMKTKGDKPRRIWITKALMKDLFHYRVQMRGERAANSSCKRKELFLNFKGEPFAADGKGLEEIIRAVGRRVGIRVYPHMLRHTYATHILSHARRPGTKINPLIFLQKQLGHESIEVTKRYVHIVDEIAEDAVMGYAEELDKFSGLPDKV